MSLESEDTKRKKVDKIETFQVSYVVICDNDLWHAQLCQELSIDKSVSIELNSMANAKGLRESVELAVINPSWASH